MAEDLVYAILRGAEQLLLLKKWALALLPFTPLFAIELASNSDAVWTETYRFCNRQSRTRSCSDRSYGYILMAVISTIH